MLAVSIWGTQVCTYFYSCWSGFSVLIWFEDAVISSVLKCSLTLFLQISPPPHLFSFLNSYSWVRPFHWIFCINHCFIFSIFSSLCTASQVAQRWRTCVPIQNTKEMWVWPLGREDPLEEGMTTHSRVLAWRTPWAEGPGRQWTIGSQRVDVTEAI